MSLLSISNLFCILLIVIGIGAIYMYVNLKVSEQNHKMTSMLGLVSTLAQEVNSLRAKRAVAEDDDYEEEQELDTNIKMFNIDERINVSDDESDNSSSDSDSDSDSEDDSEDDSNDDSNDDSEDDSEDDSDHDDDKNLLLGEVVHDELEDALEEDKIDSAIDKLELSNLDKTDNVNILLQTLVEEQNTINLSTDISTNLDEFIDSFDHAKTIHLNDGIQLVAHDSELTDFKKLSLQKLRDIVVEKGLVVDSSKLKKQELLKLLGSTSE